MADGANQGLDAKGFGAFRRAEGGIGAGLEGFEAGNHLFALGFAIRAGKLITEFGPLGQFWLGGEHLGESYLAVFLENSTQFFEQIIRVPASDRG